MEKEGRRFGAQRLGSEMTAGEWVSLLGQGYDAQLRVYDSIRVECHPRDATEVGTVMLTTMMEAGKQFSDYVPFTTDIKIGTSWGELG